MTETSRPRHIRDIAHLYLSRGKRREPAATFHLFVVGCNRRCFPAFHVANLACAMSVRGTRVRIVETSGLLPNSAYFMTQPAAFHLGLPGGAPAVARAYGVTLDLDQSHSGEDMAVDLIHLPPLEDRVRFEAALAQRPAREAGVRWGLVLHDGDFDGECAFPPQLEVTREFLLGCTERRPAPPDLSRMVCDLGGLVAWRPYLGDRVPVVVRDADAMLSRDYYSICDSLLSQMNSVRRMMVNSAGVASDQNARRGDSRSRRTGDVRTIR